MSVRIVRPKRPKESETSELVPGGSVRNVRESFRTRTFGRSEPARALVDLAIIMGPGLDPRPQVSNHFRQQIWSRLHELRGQA